MIRVFLMEYKGNVISLLWLDILQSDTAIAITVQQYTIE